MHDSPTDLLAGFKTLAQHELALAVQQVGDPDLRDAVAHLLGRGKLFRPVLCLAAYHAWGGDEHAGAAAAAASLELLHTFTLVHDDLPCMDAAELRRGVPAVHVQYGEALALLAGDSLFSLAFLQLHRGFQGRSPVAAGAATHELALAAQRVIEGQVLDLAAEGSGAGLEQIAQIHRLKTGALLGACITIGALLAVGGDSAADRLGDWRELGERIGMAFQAKDDLLSFESTEQQMGKTLSTDAEKSKATAPLLLGLEAAIEQADALRARAHELLAELTPPRPALLAELIDIAVARAT